MFFFLKYSLYILLTLLIASWICMLISLGSTSWLKITGIDKITLHENVNNTVTEPSHLPGFLLDITFTFGLSTYCVNSFNNKLNVTTERCKKISQTHPDILKQLNINEQVFKDVQRFLTLAIVFNAFAVIITIFAKKFVKKSLERYMNYAAILFIALSGIGASGSIIIAYRSMHGKSTVFQSKFGVFTVTNVITDFSFLCACVGNVFLLLTLVVYITEQKSAKKTVQSEVMSYRMLSQHSEVEVE
ncbi:uncharacterized protein LOC130656993 [Hydractinia symbiolongicarpus]|uniref:uncharacterized protein LOC130656993 n=1 Tax=Hydractinia symbiolongicarpus TaxID=13093 RepID=UPI0025518656|nr:uncharacterized protein LOC130656993 [Hydractinia symbiolongicarpus]